MLHSSKTPSITCLDEEILKPDLECLFDKEIEKEPLHYLTKILLSLFTSLSMDGS